MDKQVEKAHNNHTVVAPVHLKNLSEICETFGVGKDRVRKWYKSGAPIVLDRGYSAEYNALQAWRKQAN